MLRVLGLSLIALVLSVALWPESDRGPILIEGSGPVFESIESLADEADLVVIGVVGGVTLRKIEESTDLPFVYYDFAVKEVLGGSLSNKESDTIVVSTLDTDKVQLDQLSPLEVGQEVLLFLKEIKAADAPEGLVPFEQVFVPISDDNGVFDLINDNEVQARSTAVLSETESEVEAARQTLPEPTVDEDGRETEAPGVKQSFLLNDIRQTTERATD
jgi:hypothetical protein